MTRFTLTLSLALAAAFAPAQVTAQGAIGLLERGSYVCALPGSANGAAWIEQEGASFAITGGSSYRSARGNGTYLLEGKQVSFTRGPLKGTVLMRLSTGLLQEIGRDGKLSRLRCHRAGPLEN